MVMDALRLWRFLSYCTVLCLVALTEPSAAEADTECPEPNIGCNCTHYSTLQHYPFDSQAFCSQPNYYTPPTFPSFTVHPLSAVVDLTSQAATTLTCTISSVREFNTEPIFWEHNGVRINNSSNYTVTPTNGLASSTLTIRTPTSIESEGAYRCKVDYQHGNFTLVSKEAHLQSLRYSGWIDSISPGLSTSNFTAMSVKKGGTVVLECNPLSNDPSIVNGGVSVEWKRNNKSTPLESDRDTLIVQREGGVSYLLVSNFSLPVGEESVSYTCTLSGLAHGPTQQLSRTFILTAAKEGEQPTQLVSLPQNQTVPSGRGVSLFCINASQPSTGNTWLFEDTVLTASDSTLYLVSEEVLVIRNVSMATSGRYTCLSSSGERHVAFVEMIDDIIIRSSTHNIAADGKLELTNETFESSTGDHTISLSCQTGSQGALWNVSGNLQIEWFFRGIAIGSAHGDVSFTAQGGNLMMTSNDPWLLIGTVHCFVSISNHQADSIFSADVHVVYKGKPNPPTSINQSLQRVNYFSRRYRLSNSHCVSHGYRVTQDVLYHVEVVVKDLNEYNVCTCDRKHLDSSCNGSLQIDTAPWLANNYRHKLYIRVAMVVDNVYSDFFSYQPPGGECYEEIFVDRAPPPPVFSPSQPQFNWSASKALWNVTQAWTHDTCDSYYPQKLYNDWVTVQCLDNEHSLAENNEYSYDCTFNMACLSECNFTVTSKTFGTSYQSQSTTLISTGRLVDPPSIEHAQRVDESSFNITISLPDTSCVPPFLALNLSSAHPSMKLINISSCEPAGSSSSVKVCRITDEGSCWRDYQLRVAYRGRFGGDEAVYSNFSDSTWSLRGASEDDLLDIASIVDADVTDNSIQVHLTINVSLACYEREKGLQICRTSPTDGRSCKDTTNLDISSIYCQNLTIDTQQSLVMSFYELKADSTYCFVTKMSDSNQHRFFERGFTTMNTSSLPFKHSDLTDGKTLILASTIPASLLFVCALAVMVTIGCFCYRSHRKKGQYYRQLLNQQDNEDITNDDLVRVDRRRDVAESVYSDNTDLAPLQPYSVRRYLADPTVVVDGEEDRQSVDDALSYQEGGMEEEEEEEMERESLQGSTGNELESQSTGSLDELKKSRLSQIRKDNEASKNHQEVIEMSPLRSIPRPPSSATPPASIRSTVIGNGQPSPSLVVAQFHGRNGYQREALVNVNGYQREALVNVNGYQREAPVAVSQREAPASGYVQHAAVEGFQNPACTVPPVAPGSAVGGWTPPLSTRQASTNHDAAFTSHMTQGRHGPGSQQQRHPTAATLGGASATPMQTTVDKGQSANLSNERKMELANHGFTNSGYVISPFNGALQTTPQQSVGNGSLTNLSLSGVDEDLPLPSLAPSTSIPLSNGYVCDTSNGERENRSKSAESGNEDDSTSNEGDSNSVFDDDVTPDISGHLGRSRSTVTSGFQSGSSESASPEPPITNSPPLSPPSLSRHSNTLSSGGQNCTQTQTPLLSNLTSNPTPHSHSFAPSGLAYPFNPSNTLPLSNATPSTSYSSHYIPSLHPHMHSSSQTGSFAAYRPSSTGSSSGYVTNSSLQSYHGSSALSQSSKGTSDELEGDLAEHEPTYTVPSLLCASTSPALPCTSISPSIPSQTITHVAHGPSHYNAYPSAPPISDYYNTKDVDLRKIEMSFASPSTLTSDNVHQEVSFDFPVMSLS